MSVLRQIILSFFCLFFFISNAHAQWGWGEAYLSQQQIYNDPGTAAYIGSLQSGCVSGPCVLTGYASGAHQQAGYSYAQQLNPQIVQGLLMEGAAIIAGEGVGVVLGAGVRAAVRGIGRFAEGLRGYKMVPGGIEFNPKKAALYSDHISKGGNLTTETSAGVSPWGQVVVFEGKHRAVSAAAGDIIEEVYGGIPGKPGQLHYSSPDTPISRRDWNEWRSRIKPIMEVLQDPAKLEAARSGRGTGGWINVQEGVPIKLKAVTGTIGLGCQGFLCKPSR